MVQSGVLPFEIMDIMESGKSQSPQTEILCDYKLLS